MRESPAGFHPRKKFVLSAWRGLSSPGWRVLQREMCAIPTSPARAPADTPSPERAPRRTNPVPPPSIGSAARPEPLPPFPAHCVRLRGVRPNCAREGASQAGEVLPTDPAVRTCRCSPHKSLTRAQSPSPCCPLHRPTLPAAGSTTLARYSRSSASSRSTRSSAEIGDSASSGSAGTRRTTPSSRRTPCWTSP